jgi:hypothetical protein
MGIIRYLTRIAGEIPLHSGPSNRSQMDCAGVGIEV